jgi:tape measure domain-containing protein
MTGAEILTRFTADTSQVDKATKNYTTGLGKLTTAFTLGNLAAQGISKAIGTINANMDGAISRFDTMNNFPKVMSNLGIGTDEANKSIEILSERLQGLPTSLDSAAMAVQRLTSKNGNVQESTDMFLALNNAILAGGAGAEIQKSALEQISQAYAKGKPDMMEWRTMMMAMPAQLKQVATAMGYVDADALGTALRDGSVSMDSFMNTVMKLNTEGIPGFENFETQARNATGGVATSITNMKTAITRGITNMIGSIDESLKPFGGLSGVIQKVGKLGEKIFAKLGKTIGKLIPVLVRIGESIMPQIETMFNAISPAIEQLVQNVVPILLSILEQTMPILTQIITSIMPVMVQLINMLLPPLLQIIQMILPVVQQLLNSILPLLQPLLNLLQPLINVLMAIITPLVDIISTILPPLIDLFSTIIQTILPPLTFAFDVLATTIESSLKTVFNVVKPILDGIKTLLSGITDFIGGIFTGNWERVWNGVKNIFKGIWDGFIGIVKAPLNWIIGAINGFIDGLNKIQIPDWVPAVGGKGLNIPKIPQLNVGTNYVPDDTLAMIHKGEAVIPKKFNPYANGIKPQTIGSMNAISPTINVQVYNDIKQDPLGQMVSNIKTFSGGAKNDYNYGMGN